MTDPTPCTSPNSHRLQCSTHPDRMQLFCRAVLAISHSQRVFLLIPVTVLYHTLHIRLSYRIRQTVCHHYRCLNPVDRVGKVVKSIFQHTSVGLQLTIDRHKHCLRDASWMPSRLSTVLAQGSSSRAPAFHLSRVRPSLPACDASLLLLLPCSAPKHTHQTWHRDPPLKTACTVCAFLGCFSVNTGLTFRSIVAVLPALVVFPRVHLWNSPSGTCSFLPLRILHL